jgi:hypothetical protein
MFFACQNTCQTPEFEYPRQIIASLESNVFTPGSYIPIVNTVTGSLRTVTAAAVVVYAVAMTVLTSIGTMTISYLSSTLSDRLYRELGDSLVFVQLGFDELSRGIIELIPFFGSVAASWIDGPPVEGAPTNSIVNPMDNLRNKIERQNITIQLLENTLSSMRARIATMQATSLLRDAPELASFNQ